MAPGSQQDAELGEYTEFNNTDAAATTSQFPPYNYAPFKYDQESIRWN